MKSGNGVDIPCTITVPLERQRTMAKNSQAVDEVASIGR